MKRASALLARLGRRRAPAPPDPLTKFVEQAAMRLRQELAGPFEPPPPLDGQFIGPPDYVGVAAEKSGTTWWYRLLVSHPEIVGVPRKELHYFQHHWDADFDAQLIAAYHRYFPRTEGQLAGEWTPRYAVDPWTPGRLAASAPNARLLVMLRDPVDRFRSGATHELHRFGIVQTRMLVENFERGRYASQINRLLQYFPEEQILVLQFEACLRDPAGEYRRTLQFLGVDPGYSPENIGDRVHGAKVPHVNVPADLRLQLVRDY
jgi:hypothetical protein